MSLRHSTTVCVALCLAGPGVARANDGAFGGSGASLAPLASTPIRMLREDITMELTGRPLAWSVSATYEFENPTDAAVVVQMGYPESRCDEQEGDCVGQGGRFRGLLTRVRGRPVRHRVGRLAEGSAWAMEVARVYLFDVTFAPRERVRVEHRYTYDRSFTAVVGENVFYLTRTGSLWNGPIGQARFTVRTPVPPWLVEHPPAFRLLSWDRVVRGSHGMTELVLEARDFRATVDFGLVLATYAQLEAGGTIGDGSVDPSECVGALNAASGSPVRQRHAQQWLREASRDDLGACRSLVFALSGHRFRNARWTAAFYGGRARAPTGNADWVVATMRPASAFAAAQLPAHHGAFVRRIDAELARRPAPAGGAATDLE